MPIPIPPLFLERMSHFLGDEYPGFEKALEQPPLQGLRINPLKISVEKFKEITPYPLGAGISWCDSAFQVDPEDEYGKHPYHKAGLFYLQDPSAMSAAELLGAQAGERILDLAAAPGGKTTHLASLMEGTGLLIANDIKGKRVGHLAMNVERWGAGNVIVTNETPERLADHFGAWFDRVLVDAPCSGEGMFRKEISARMDWSLEMVEGCAIRQRNILKVAAKLIRPGGFLGYSTCTFAPEENEGVIDRFLLEEKKIHGSQQFEVVQLNLQPGFMPGRPDWISGDLDQTINGAVRLFPHRLVGEGHFVCILKRKEGEGKPEMKKTRVYPPSKIQVDLFDAFAGETLSGNLPMERLQVFGERLYLMPEIVPDLVGLRVIHPGTWVGTFKKNRFEPAHPFAIYLKMTHAKKVINFKVFEDAGAYALIQKYLMGENIPTSGIDGWTLVCVDGYPLGWGKQVQGILKNHYPHGWMS